MGVPPRGSIGVPPRKIDENNANRHSGTSQITIVSPPLELIFPRRTMRGWSQRGKPPPGSWALGLLGDWAVRTVDGLSRSRTVAGFGVRLMPFSHNEVRGHTLRRITFFVLSQEPKSPRARAHGHSP